MVKTLQLESVQNGVIWPRKPFINLKGLLACIKNVSYSSLGDKTSRFRSISFNMSGDIIAATDEKGRVFVLFLKENRYSLVRHLGTPTIATCFSSIHKFELLVTCEKEMARCIDVSSMNIICTLKGHCYSPQCAAFQRAGKFALTGSVDAVILWDTSDWTRFRILNAGPGVQHAIFVTKGDLIAVCFQDATIMMWELESLALKYRYVPPTNEKPPLLNTISVSQDNRFLIASGQSASIFVWEIESQAIVRVIELSCGITQAVKHICVPNCEDTLSILGSNGAILCVDIGARRPQVKLKIHNSEKPFKNFDVDPAGRYLCTCSDGYLLIYDLDIARDTARKVYAIQQDEGILPSKNSYLRVRSGLEKRKSFTATKDNAIASIPEVSNSSKIIDHIFKIKSRPIIHESRKSDTNLAFEGKTFGDSQSGVTSHHDKNTNLSPSHAKVCKSEGIKCNRKRLQTTLKCYGRYPKKYRLLVWQILLELPKNTDAFVLLKRKGAHPIFANLSDQYPIQDARLFRRLRRVLSALVYWCPAFGEATFLAPIVYPFVKQFKNNDLAAFESSMSVLVHWCGDFLVNTPLPPRMLLLTIEMELKKLDPKVFDHLVQHDVGVDVYGWSLLRSIFTEVLNEEEWNCLWDHLLTNLDDPDMLLAAVLAYILYFRVAILGSNNSHAIEQCFHQQNPLEMSKYIQLIYNLRRRTRIASSKNFLVGSEENTASSFKDDWQRKLKHRYVPLAKGQYPPFSNYPKDVVDQEIKERHRIALELAEIAEKKRLLERLQRESTELELKHREWLQQKQLLHETEEKRKQESAANERDRISNLRVLDQQTRRLRLERLETMENTARQTLEESLERMKEEAARIEDEFERHQERVLYEIAARKEDEELRRVELDAERRIAEIQKHFDVERRVHNLRNEYITRAKQQESLDLLKLQNWKREDEEEKNVMQKTRQGRERTALSFQENEIRQTLDNQFKQNVLKQEEKLLELHSERKASTKKAVSLCSDTEHGQHAITTAVFDTEADGISGQSMAFNKLKHARNCHSDHQQDVSPKEAATNSSVWSSLSQIKDKELLQATTSLIGSDIFSETSLSASEVKQTLEEMRVLESALNEASSENSAFGHHSSGSTPPPPNMYSFLSSSSNVKGFTSPTCNGAQENTFASAEVHKETNDKSEFACLRQKALQLLSPDKEWSVSDPDSEDSSKDESSISNFEFESKMLLQRPIEELEIALALSSETHEEEKSDPSSSDFETEQIFNNRDKILQRAKRLLQQ